MHELGLYGAIFFEIWYVRLCPNWQAESIYNEEDEGSVDDADLEALDEGDEEEEEEVEEKVTSQNGTSSAAINSTDSKQVWMRMVFVVLVSLKPPCILTDKRECSSRGRGWWRKFKQEKTKNSLNDLT